VLLLNPGLAEMMMATYTQANAWNNSAQFTNAEATYVRTNAWNNGGTFDNPNLLWYARGVAAMQARELNDPSSWWFFAAIHGEYVKMQSFPGWGYLPSPPPVPTTPEPSITVSRKYWDQCQHQSWYFLPWHRGYLLALEAQIRQAVVELGGPSTWALPYWNYLGPANEYRIPPAFTQATLPDGSPNPLFVKARYGPKGDGDIYVPVAPTGPVNNNCMANNVFTGNDSVTPPPGFGGPATGFSHDGSTSGNLESNPHNLVHVFVGGTAPGGATYGLMSDPGIAGLDPIFYLHHANIDRMWAIWNADPDNLNPSDPTWLNGPAAIGEREFVMPLPTDVEWVYTPQEMTSLKQLDYTYDNLPAPPAAANLLADRLTRLGVSDAAARAKGGSTVTAGTRLELVGTSEQPLPIKGTGVTTSVRLDPTVLSKVSRSFAATAETAAPDRTFLNLENVRGTHDATVLNVYINLPAGAKPIDHPELLAGSVGLFGLRRASLQDGEHAGQGLNFILEITALTDKLHLDQKLDADSLQVSIVPYSPVPDQAQVTVGRVSLYRQGR
jgi:tyrosinase